VNKLKHRLVTLRRKILFFWLWPLIFKKASKKPVNPKLILFAFSKNYTSLPDNMVGLYEHIKNEGFDCQIMQSPQNPVKRFFFDLKFQKYYAQCKCVFVTDNFDPLYANKPNKGTKVIQLWHACGAFKKWGYSTLDLPWGGSREDMTRFPMHNTYTDVFVSSESVIPCYAEAFNCPKSIIKAFGTPRTDVFFDEEFVASGRDEMLKLFPEIGNRKIILYAPTFRGNSPDEAYNDMPLDYSKLKNALCNEYVLVLKLHPFTAKKYSLSDKEKAEFGDFVFDASNTIKIDKALCAADILIADYSSLIFEYSLLNRPMLFYSYDLNKYEHDRSFYFDYKSFVPGKIVIDNDEIIDSIKNNDFRQGRVKPFKDIFMNACDGKCVKRIAGYAIF
jgi:CDP-glycerol glycerophosphotransferase (TagB/SpsB family)